MAVEARRGCGYRKVGGLYLVSKGVGMPCDRLPYPLHVCPTCNQGVKQVRGFQWIAADMLSSKPACRNTTPGCIFCPVCNTSNLTDPVGKAGLLWIGAEHYTTPDDWSKEAISLGVSRRVSALPDGLVLGKTWVLVAHPKAVPERCRAGGQPCSADCEHCKGTGTAYTPGIFHAFKPDACELIVTPSMKKQRWVRKLVKDKGVRLVEVPENDKDHAPTVRQSARRKAMARASRKATAGGEEE